MKIKMKTLMAGPGGTRLPDHVYDISSAEAKALIDGGYAVEVRESTKKQIPEPESVPDEKTGRTDAAETDGAKIENAERSVKSGSSKAVKAA